MSASITADFPLTIPRDELVPWGEEGELFVIRGWWPDFLLVQGALATMVDQTSWGEVADLLSEHILPWNEDDTDKPEDQYHEEVAAVFLADHIDDVAYGWARFWTEEDRDWPGNPYGLGSGYECGVSIARTQETPEHVPATWLREH